MLLDCCIGLKLPFAVCRWSTEFIPSRKRNKFRTPTAMETESILYSNGNGNGINSVLQFDSNKKTGQRLSHLHTLRNRSVFWITIGGVGHVETCYRRLHRR